MKSAKATLDCRGFLSETSWLGGCEHLLICRLDMLEGSRDTTDDMSAIINEMDGHEMMDGKTLSRMRLNMRLPTRQVSGISTRASSGRSASGSQMTISPRTPSCAATLAPMEQAACQSM